MQVVRAEAMGMCFGVRDALTLAHEIAEPKSTTIHGELVHNATVLADLEERGFAMTGEGSRTALPPTVAVMVTAHGISNRERDRLQGAGKSLIDTTCPLVRRVHDAAQRLEADGYFVVVAGRRGHVEVRGIVEDLAHHVVVESADEVEAWPYGKIGIISQSTAAAADVAAIRTAVIARHPAAQVRFIDTVCRPTKERQAALETLLDRVPAVIVVGGENSNNTRRLVERARARGVLAQHVQGPDDVDIDGLRGIDTVGLTAGTSTPDAVIDAVARLLESI